MENKVLITTKNFIWCTIIIGLLLRMHVMQTMGEEMFIFSDDVGYLRGAIDFLKSGYITYGYRTYMTVFGMPGPFILIAFIFKIFGYGTLGITALRILFILISCLTIYGVYLCSLKVFKNYAVANIAAILIAVYPPYISLSNIFLTETLAFCCIVFLTYFLLDFCEKNTNRSFLIMLTIYLITIFIKPTFGIYPIFFAPLMFYKKIPFRQLVIKGLVAVCAIGLALFPWTLRNYIITDDIIPLSGNQGDTKLLGTTMGITYLDGTYAELVELADERVLEKNYEISHPYYRFKERGILADERIEEWKELNYKNYFTTTFVTNPNKILKSIYYPIQVLDITHNQTLDFYMKNLIMVGISMIIILIEFIKNKNGHKFLSSGCIIAGFTAVLILNTSYAPLTRYGAQNALCIFLISSYAIYKICDTVIYAFKFLKGKINESFSNNSSL